MLQFARFLLHIFPHFRSYKWIKYGEPNKEGFQRWRRGSTNIFDPFSFIHFYPPSFSLFWRLSWCNILFLVKTENHLLGSQSIRSITYCYFDPCVAGQISLHPFTLVFMIDFLILITEEKRIQWPPFSCLECLTHPCASDNWILPEFLIQSTTQTYGSPEDELLGEEIDTHSITFLSNVSLCSLLIWRLAWHC